MKKHLIAIILIIIGLGVVVAAAVAAGNGSSILSGIQNGNSVSCNVGVNAALLTGKLGIVSTTSCHAVGSCFVNPANGFSILGWLTGTDQNGQVLMLQSGKVYGSSSV